MEWVVVVGTYTYIHYLFHSPYHIDLVEIIAAQKYYRDDVGVTYYIYQRNIMYFCQKDR